MRTASIIGLRIAARLFGSMAENNPRVIENRNWQMASWGTAGLIKDIESLNGFAEVIVPVDFSEESIEAELARADALKFEDPRQLHFGMGGVR